jgi:hypothetical protein
MRESINARRDELCLKTFGHQMTELPQGLAEKQDFYAIEDGSAFMK